MPINLFNILNGVAGAKPTAGTAVTLGTAGLSVTATTTRGVFTVTDVDEANGVCCGFF